MNKYMNKYTKRACLFVMLSMCCLLWGCHKMDGPALSGPDVSESQKAMIQAESPPKVHLKLTYSGKDIVWISKIEEIVASFTTLYPSIEIELDPGREGVYMEYLKASKALNDFPDIMEIEEPLSFVKSGKIGIIPDDASGLVNDPLTYNSRIFALPMYSTTYGMIYNTEMFDRYQLTPPKDYQQFLDLCETLKKKGIAPIGIAGDDMRYWNYWINYYFIKDVLCKIPDWQYLRGLKKASFADECAAGMLKDFKLLFDKGYIDENFIELTENQLATSFVQGDIAMLYAGPMLFSQIQNTDADMSFSWFFLPDEQGNVMAAKDTKSYWALSKECTRDQQKAEAASLFLQYFYQTENYRKILISINAIPTTRQTVLYPSIEVQQDLLVNYRYAEKFSSLIGSLDTPETFNNAMSLIVKDYVLDTVSLEDTAVLLDSAWDKARVY